MCKEKEFDRVLLAQNLNSDCFSVFYLIIKFLTAPKLKGKLVI